MALCKELQLLGVDGSFFHADASDASITTRKTLEKELQQIELAIDAYHQRMDGDDEREEANAKALDEGPELKAKLARLEARQARNRAQIKQLHDSGETQISRTDPDARALSKGKQHVTGYNVQSSVDDKHKLIVHYEVTNAGNDQGQLSVQCTVAKDVLGVEEITALADSGYYSEAELAACEEAGISVYMPIPDKHKAVSAHGRISGKHFHYASEVDAYICPGGQLLRPQSQGQKKNGVLRIRYTRPAGQCKDCSLQAACLSKPGARRSTGPDVGSGPSGGLSTRD